MSSIKLEHIIDSTLREGEQTPRVYFKPEEKCTLAKMIYETVGEKLYMEVGSPYSPKYRVGVESVVKYFKELGYGDAKLIGHCRCLREDVDIAWKCGTWGVTIFLSPTERHLLYKLNGMSYEKALATIRDVVHYAKNNIGFECVIYTMEDATSLPIEKIIEVGKVAEEAGADILKIPDTKGQAEPLQFREILAEASEEIDIPLDVHCHNDRGLAVVNSIMGLLGGARSFDVTVMGIGERCGIADLVTSVENLESLYGVKTGVDFKKIPQLYSYLSAISGIPINPFHPIVGVFARTHKAGTHQKAVLKCPETYETIDFSKYGLERLYEFGAMQSKELIEVLLSEYDIDQAVKSKIVDIIRTISMEKGRDLRLSEVWNIIQEETGKPVKTKPGFSVSIGDAIIFVKVKPGHSEQDVVEGIRKLLAKYNVPFRIREITGYWDYIIDIKDVSSTGLLDSITQSVRSLSLGIEETSTSIVFDEFK
ncbi:MAG: hypothetical protein QXM89_01530 [Candidatus Bathyarchaeia archaeon]